MEPEELIGFTTLHRACPQVVDLTVEQLGSYRVRITTDRVVLILSLDEEKTPEDWVKRAVLCLNHPVLA